MRVIFTNVDSTGSAVTKRKKVQIDGETHIINVASTGTANVPEDVGTFLVNSEDYAVEAYSTED